MSAFRKWTTAEITADLETKLRNDQFLVAREAVLRPDTMQRADLLAMRRKLAPLPMVIFEIKVSRSDFSQDIRSGKWRGYLADGAVVFAVPAGLVELQEVPPEAGLIVRIAQGWSWRRSPRKDAPKPSDYLLRRMALTASDQAAERAAAAHRPRSASLYAMAKKARTEQARQVAKIAQDVDLWRRIVADETEKFHRVYRAKERLYEEMAELEARRRRLLAELAA